MYTVTVVVLFRTKSGFVDVCPSCERTTFLSRDLSAILHNAMRHAREKAGDGEILSLTHSVVFEP
jgi:hypothetical protein